MPGRASEPSAQPAEPVETAGAQVAPPAPAGGRTSPAPAAGGALEPEPLPPLGLVELDPWSIWPAPARLPMPVQTARSAPPPALPPAAKPLPIEPTLAEPAPAQPAAQAATGAEPMPLAPLVVGGFALLAMVAASTRRSRLWLASAWSRWIEQLRRGIDRLNRL
jgi:hypothetical protein